MESDLDNKLPFLDVVDSFPSWAASKLSAVLLPPLPPVVQPSSRSRLRARSTPLSKPATVVKKGPKRPSLRYVVEHCAFSVNFGSNHYTLERRFSKGSVENAPITALCKSLNLLWYIYGKIS